MQTASIGRVVYVLVDPADNNGSDVAPALVTRVWGEPYAGPLGNTQAINARVLLDGRETPWLTSISLYAERPSGDALAAHNQHNPNGHYAVAFWPPRLDSAATINEQRVARGLPPVDLASPAEVEFRRKPASE